MEDYAKEGKVPSSTMPDVPAFPTHVMLSIRGLSSETLDACVSTVRAHLANVMKVEEHLKLLIVEIATKAVFCPELAATAAHLCGRLDQSGETKGFRAALLSQCESTFNTLGNSSQAWQLPAAIGLGSFIGALHAEGLLRGKIVHSCMARSLFGAECSKDHIPNAPSLVFLCTLYVSVEQARGFSEQRHRALYRKRMEELKKMTSVDEACRERLSAALGVGEEPKPAAVVSPSQQAGYRHDPYAQVDVDTAAHSPTTPVAASPLTAGGVQAPFPQSQPSTPVAQVPQQQQQQYPQQVMPIQPAPMMQQPQQVMHMQQQPQQPHQVQQVQQQQQQQPVMQPQMQPVMNHQQVPQRTNSLPPEAGFQPQPLQPVYPMQPAQPTQPAQPAQPAAGSAQAFPTAVQLPAAQVSTSMQAEAASHLPMSQYVTQPTQLTQDALSQWVTQSAPLCGAKRVNNNKPVAPPQPQPPMDLAQLYHEAAVYKSRGAAVEAFKKHNVAVPQPYQHGYPSPAYQPPPQQQPPPPQQQPHQQPPPQHQPQYAPTQIVAQPAQPTPQPPPQQFPPKQNQQNQQNQQFQQQPIQPMATPANPPPPKEKVKKDKPEEKEKEKATPTPKERKQKEEIAETDIFAACASKQESRRLGNLIINRALQEGYNRSYGAARRKLSRFCRTQGIGEGDQGKLIGYLNDLYLAGQQYRGLCLKEFVDAPTRLQDELQQKPARPTPGGMRSARRHRTFDDDDEIESVYSCGTAGTDTWGDQISDDELDELSGWVDFEDRSRPDYLSSHGRASSMADSVASEPADPTDLTTPVHSPLDIDEVRQSGAASVSSRRSSRGSALSRTSSKSGLCYSKLPEDMTIDDRVKVVRPDGSEQPGIIKYIGFPHFADKGDTYDGCWVGVSLDLPVGNHDGTIEDERFFVAKPQHGVFVRENKVVRQCDQIEGPVFFYPQHLTKRLLRFDIRTEALRPFNFASGDIIAATHMKYKGQGKRGIVIGVRHGLLYWQVEDAEINGACACKNTQEEIIEVFKRKKYKKVGSSVLPNHLANLTESNQGRLAAPHTEGVSEASLANVAHLVDPEKANWEGSLVSPTPAQGYQKWFKNLWRKKKIDAAVAQQ